jgi:hypothetical protein
LHRLENISDGFEAELAGVHKDKSVEE